MKKYIGKHIIVIVWVLIAFLLLLPEAYAIMIPLSTEQLTSDSDTVVRGSVLNIESKWTKKKETIVTQVSVSVIEVLDGEIREQLVSAQDMLSEDVSRNVITVEYDGGEVDGIGFGVSDSPKFKEREEVVLFLKEGKSKVAGEVYALVGSAQGKYAVDEDGIVKKEEDKKLIDNHISLNALVDKIDGDAGHSFIWVDRSKDQQEKKTDTRIVIFSCMFTKLML